MLRITATNEISQTLDLSSDGFILTHVDGLTATANVNTSPLATTDGSIFTSSRLTDRSVVLTIVIDGDVEANRLQLEQIFRAKHWVRLNLTTKSRDVWIEGHVTTPECDPYQNREAFQPSILCPDPYFKASKQKVIDTSDYDTTVVMPEEYAEEGDEVTTLETSGALAVRNPSDDPVGFILQLQATEAVSSITVANTTTGVSLTVNADAAAGDEILLDTRRGSKGIRKISGGVTTDIISGIDVSGGLAWPILALGGNTITVSEGLAARLVLRPIYQGV